jgi:phage tail-like protein
VSIELAQVALPAAFTSTAASGDSGVADFTSRYFGLAMRFAVTFTSEDGARPLGEWSACKGLKIEFKTETVKQGGQYGYEVKLPVQVAYGPVTLERAMEQSTSQQLQTWLGNLVQKWMNSAGPGSLKSPPAGNVTIRLQDMYQNVVASWTLRQAFPVSWSGPTLDARGSTVAIESLTLEHQGFLPPSADPGY